MWLIIKELGSLQADAESCREKDCELLAGFSTCI